MRGDILIEIALLQPLPITKPKETSSAARTSSYKRRAPTGKPHSATSLKETASQSDLLASESAKDMDDDHDGIELDVEGIDDEFQ
ncbi:hypothetical protein A0J61_09497 [Choanephora cucurbitarum]|uniref:Uncharacterized protein n=1 Tax=Choanephora cucurbitarum TaxID=101091 RepID=A0A1C7N075_9FUNG|nr:hypothetical protein A0J61_09497 [Choanephora cucurbitarum]